MSAGSCFARDAAGQELRGPWAGAGDRGQLPTRWHCWSSVGLPGSSVRVAPRGCSGALSSSCHRLGRTRVGPRKPHWEPPPGLSGSQRAWHVCQWGIQNSGMSLQGLGTFGCHCRHRACCGKGAKAAPGPDTAPALLPQMTSPQGSMGSCTSSSTLPRASSSQPVSVGAHPAWSGLGRVGVQHVAPLCSQWSPGRWWGCSWGAEQCLLLQTSTAHWRWTPLATSSARPRPGCSGTPRSRSGMR